jgi:enoyl-CoA hydratase
MPQVEVRNDGHVTHVHLTRPEKYNALSLDMYAAISDALTRLDADPDLRVAVLSAEGKHFTAGVELDQWAPYFGGGKGWPIDAEHVDPMGFSGRQHRKP